MVRASSALVVAGLLGSACVHGRVAELPPAVSTAGQRAQITVGGVPYEVSSCRSGSREYFLGVDLLNGVDDPFLRVVIDPLSGPRLRWRGAGEQSVLGPHECATLRVRVAATGWWVNHVQDVAGSIEAECTTETGTQLSIHARFDHCH